MTVVHVQAAQVAPGVTQRQITFVSPGWCSHPVRFTAGPLVAWVRCGRRLPSPQQCPGCRIRTVIEPTPTDTATDTATEKENR